MGDAIINTFKGLGFWRISLLLLLLVASGGAVYGIYLWVGPDDADALEEDQQIVTVAQGNLVNQVVISGSLLFPTRETLKFETAGVVEELRVEEGDRVEAGQVIAALDVETVAGLRVEVDDARVKIQGAEEAIDDFNNPYSALDLVLAEEKVVTARVALQEAEESLEDLLTLPDLKDDIADAELEVAGARLAVANAEDAMNKLTAAADSDEVAQAVAKIDSLELSLENAQRELDLLDEDWGGRLDDAGEKIDDALSEYGEVVLRFLGAELNEADSLLPPQEMIAAWGTSLESLFSSPPVDSFTLADSLELVDDPGTPWSEVTIQGWTLFSFGSTIAVCDEDALLPDWQTCVNRELEAPWEKLEEAREPLENLQKQYEAARAKSEAGISDIEQSLKDAQADLGDLFETPDQLEVENALYSIDKARMDLWEAEQGYDDLLEQLLERPDPVDVEASQKALETARATLVQAEEDLASLFDPPDPLQRALLQSRMVSAQLGLDAAEARLKSAVVVAPWDGVVASVDVERGDEVNRNADIVEIVNPLDVELDGIVDEIDVLSVRVGDEAVVSMDALPGQSLTGVVSRIDAGATNQQGVVTYPVRVRMTVPADLNLIEGLSGVAEVVIQQEFGLLIPVQAVMGRFDAPVVQVMEDGVIRERAVTLGISDDFWVIVTSGLVEGEQVVFQAPDSSGFNFGGFRGAGSSGFILRGGPGR